MSTGASKRRGKKSAAKNNSWLSGFKPSRSLDDISIGDDESSRGKNPPARARSSNASAESANSEFSTMASLAAVIVEASASNVPADSPSTEAWPLSAATCRDENRQADDLEAIIGGDEPREEIFRKLEIHREEFNKDEAFITSPPVPNGEDEKEKTAVHLGRRRWILIITIIFIFVVFLTIGTKKIALGISISAVAALMMETIFRSLLPLVRICEDEEVEGEKMNGTEGISDVIVDDKIVDSRYKYETDTRKECKWNAAEPIEGVFPDEAEETLPEEEEKAEEDGRIRNGKEAKRPSGKTKKLLKRLVRKRSAALSVDKEE